MPDDRDDMNRRRDRAEELAGDDDELKGYSERDLQDLVHELRAHQIELELQNDELRLSHAELDLARAEYARLYDEAPVGYFSIDEAGRIARVNRTGARLLDGRPAAFVGRRFSSYVAGDSQDTLHRFLVRLQHTRARQSVELTMRRASGEPVHVRIEGMVSGSDGQGWRALVSDLTREHTAEQALAASEARYGQLVKYAPAAIYEVEVPSGRFLTVNDVMSEITGYSQQELLSMTGFDLTDAAGRALFAERLQRLAAGLPVPESVEFRVFTRDGRAIDVLLHTRLVVEHGKPARVFVVGHEVTDLKRAEEDLRLIMEGTAALTGRDFFRAVARHLARLLDARYVLVGRLDQEALRSPGLVHTRAVWADGAWEDNFTFPLAAGVLEQLMRNEPCYYSTGFRQRFAGDPLLERWNIDSYRALSLRDVQNEVQGVLIVADDRPMGDDPRADPILTIFANRAAAELMRQESEAALRRYANQQAALYAVASTLTTTLEPAQLLGSVLSVVAPLFGADAAWVTVTGNTRDEAPSVLASHGLGPDVDLEAIAAPLNTCTACIPYRDGTGDVELRIVYRCDDMPLDMLPGVHIGSHACLPLAAHGRILGTLTLVWRDTRELQRAEEGLLLAIGYQVALGLHNARLYQQTRQVDRLYLLAELNDALVTTLNPLEVASIALEAVAAAVRAPRALFLPYADSLGRYPDHVLALHDGWIDVDASERYREWRPLLGRLRQQQADADHMPHLISLPAGELSDEFLVVPINDNDQRLADLVLSGTSFGADDVAVSWAAAGRTAQAFRNAYLYEEVRELLREREETQAQLVHSEKMAALGRLTASVSHEINNPVQAVLGCLGLAMEELDEDADEETVDHYLAIAMQELRRIATIVRRMREFYRPAEHEWDVADVNETVQAVVDLTRNQLLGRNVRVELDLGKVPPIPIRPDQIRQVFLNLILNAADAMPAGGTLTLRTRVDEARLSQRVGGRAVRIEVADTGTGMPPEMRGRLFEPFFTTKRSGSGLGLYISHGIVQTHAGEIEVDSELGQGTTIRIWLPMVQPTEFAGS